MYPSKTPFIYVLHFLVILVILGGALFLGYVHAQPLAMLSLLALKFLPEVHLIPEPEVQEERLYDGQGAAGFLAALTEQERRDGE